MSSSNTTTYDHTQAGTVTRVVFLVTIPPLCLFWWFMSAPMFTVLPFLVLMALGALTFHSLNVRVDDEAVHLRFGIGLIKRSIPFETITGCAPERTSWLTGWGIRYHGRGWLWNVSGFDAIRVDRSKGGSFFIGTDQPDALEAAITAGLSSGHDG